MLDPYDQSAILLYQSTTVTSLKGSLINFVEFCDLPILFSVISKNSFSIYIINPYSDFHSFLSDLIVIFDSIELPLYLFQYDDSCLKKYVNFNSIFTLSSHIRIEDKRFSDLEDFYSFTLPECFGPFFSNSLYIRFGQTGDPTDIINCVKSIMFSKLVLVIDMFSTHSFTKPNKNSFSIIQHGRSPISLPDHSCILDIQTIWIDEHAEIIIFSLFKDDIFNTYYLNDITPNGLIAFRKFIAHSLHSFDSMYVFEVPFVDLFFPQITNFIDLKFNKYKTSARNLVHLPYHHLEVDPTLKKRPIYYNFKDSSIELLSNRSAVNVLTKLAILSSNECKLPFFDHIMADLKRIRPNDEYFERFGEIKNNLIKKKVFYRPTEFVELFCQADNLFPEMYSDELMLDEIDQVEHNSSDF